MELAPNLMLLGFQQPLVRLDVKIFIFAPLSEAPNAVDFFRYKTYIVLMYLNSLAETDTATEGG